MTYSSNSVECKAPQMARVHEWQSANLTAHSDTLPLMRHLSAHAYNRRGNDFATTWLSSVRYAKFQSSCQLFSHVFSFDLLDALIE